MTATRLTPALDLGYAKVPVAEMFLSFQGEGVSLGRRALFVRFMGCNLTCGYTHLPRSADAVPVGAMVCDSEYTWRRTGHGSEAVESLTPGQIWARLIGLDPATANPRLSPVDLLVVSGGEPLLRRNALLYLADQAQQSDRRVEIETNATISPGSALLRSDVAFNASPKLASSALPRPQRIKPQVMRELQDSGRARWKFIVTGPADLDEIASLQDEFGLTEIWLSPEGITVDAVLAQMRMAADMALHRGWNLTTRQHVLIWGNERGR